MDDQQRYRNRSLWLDGALEHDIEAEIPVPLLEQEVAHLHRARTTPRHEAVQVPAGEDRKGDIGIVCH